MTHLRSLKMTMGEQYSEMLVLCTARIQSFECSYRCNHNLIRLLESQSDLTTLKLSCDLKGHYRASKFLPKLTKLDAPMSWLSALVPGRPVKDVNFYKSSSWAIPTFVSPILYRHCHQYRRFLLVHLLCLLWLCHKSHQFCQRSRSSLLPPRT